MEPSAKTRQHIAALFSPSDRSAAERLLADLIPVSAPADSERVHWGALRVSHGDLAQLAEVVRWDWRDTLMAAGFGHDVHAHETWIPRPLTTEAIAVWREGGEIDGVLFRCGEPANLHRRGRIEGEPALVIALVALLSGEGARVAAIELVAFAPFLIYAIWPALIRGRPAMR